MPRPRTHGFTRPLFAGDDTVANDIQDLRAAGATNVVEASSVKSGVELSQWIADAAIGDRLVVTSLERLSFQVAHLVGTLLTLNERGVALSCLDRPGLEAGDRHVVEMLQALDGAHRHNVSLAVRAGMVGRPVGRPRALSPEQVAVAAELRRLDRSYARIAQVLGVSASAVQRALNR